MKLEFDCIEDFYEMAEFVSVGRAMAHGRQVTIGPRTEAMPRAAELASDTTPTKIVEEDDVPTPDADIAGFDQEDESDADRSIVNALTGADSNGLPWDERIHSNPPKKNADGSWRARRGVDKALVAEVTAELMVDRIKATVGEEAWAEAMTPPDAAPAVTETHPLPVDEPETKPEADDPHADDDAALKATFFEVVEQARKPAEDIQKDDIATTLQAAQAFTKAHSPHAFRLLRETITDKTLPGMTPGERRVLLAAMEMYNPAGWEL